MLGAIWDYVVEFYKETKDVKWYNTGFSKTWLYTVYDVTAAYIQFVLLHKWNPYTEEMFEITDKINFTGIRKRLYNKIKKVNGCL
jgi:hypothetical protein